MKKDKYEAFFDGACEPYNPGGTMAYGACINCNGTQVWSHSGLNTTRGIDSSNNMAEYAGLYIVLKYFINKNLVKHDITIFGDSALVIKQMTGQWRINKSTKSFKIATACKQLLEKFTNLTLVWIPSIQNQEADALTTNALNTIGLKRTEYNKK